MANGTVWTDQEIKILRAMSGAGKTLADAKRVFVSRTTTAITKKASQLGLSLAGKPPEIDMAEFKRLMGK